MASGSSSSTLLMPGSVAAKGAFLASASCGWWWLAMAWITPFFTASRSASRSARVRSGGCTWYRLEKSRSASSVRISWYSATSAVTGRPRCWARAISSTPRALVSWLKCARTPACSTSSRLRVSATVSAVSGMPARPRKLAVGPSWARPPSASSGSWEVNTTVRSKVAAYSSERSRTRLLAIGARPLVKATQPVSRRAASSESCSPARLRVSAPTGKTLVLPASRARSRISSATAGVSSTGLVCGGQHRLVTPPAAAARVSLSMLPLRL
ncbi:hypothetical protein D9M68_202080 [compost metagenome]